MVQGTERELALLEFWTASASEWRKRMRVAESGDYDDPDDAPARVDGGSAVRVHMVHPGAPLKPLAPRPCKMCGEPFVPPYSSSLYCSTECNPNLHQKKPPRVIPCGICGTPFAAKNKRALYCSAKCGKEAIKRQSADWHKARNTGRQEASTYDGPPCRVCGGTERYSNNRQCVPCSKARAVKYRKRSAA